MKTSLVCVLHHIQALTCSSTVVKTLGSATNESVIDCSGFK